MKALALTIAFFLFLETRAQINIVPFAGVNSTKMKTRYFYENGGTFGIVGFELELRKKPKSHHAAYLTLVTGLSYLKNGFNYSYSFSYTALSYYTQNVTDMQMEYLQMPLIVRLNWQPFPLVEDWHIFFGAGLSNNLLIKSHLAEQYTYVFISSDLLAPPETTHYEDSQDVTEYGKKTNLFQRFEIGIKYKRIQLTWRLSQSITDMYCDGLETFWGVPDENSDYISAQQANGKTKEKYSELVVGFRIGK